MTPNLSDTSDYPGNQHWGFSSKSLNRCLDRQKNGFEWDFNFNFMFLEIRVETKGTMDSVEVQTVREFYKPLMALGIGAGIYFLTRF